MEYASTSWQFGYGWFSKLRCVQTNGGIKTVDRLYMVKVMLKRYEGWVCYSDNPKMIKGVKALEYEITSWQMGWELGQG